jgi:hypothetical protein
MIDYSGYSIALENHIKTDAPYRNRRGGSPDLEVGILDHLRAISILKLDHSCCACCTTRKCFLILLLPVASHRALSMSSQPIRSHWPRGKFAHLVEPTKNPEMETLA